MAEPREPSAARKLAAIGMGSLTVIVISLLAWEASRWVASLIGAKEPVAEAVGWLVGMLVAFGLTPVYFSSRVSDAIYGFWMRRIAGLSRD